MKIFSLNCRGLASPKKKSSLKRLITIHNLDIIFLQETLGITDIVTHSLEELLPGCSFVAIDAKGCSQGLAIGWRLKSVKCENVWGFNMGISLSIFSAELGHTLVIINVYSHYVYWK
jgi:hypothetical protein